METEKPENESPLRNARRLGIAFLTYAIVFPFVTLILPENELPVSTGSTILSWVMILLMPVEILLIYMLYRYSSKRFGLNNIQGLAALMYTFAIAPSIYAFAIGFTDSTLRSVAIPLGLMFSLTGFWFALKLLSNFWDDLTSYDQR